MSSVDLVVVGGGVMGAATAWRATGRGASVVLVDQHAPGHHRGSSHGSSRIFRHAYVEPAYVAMAARARRGWAELEAMLGAPVLRPVGAVDHGDPATVDRLEAALGEGGVASTRLDPGEAEARWPGLRFDATVLHHEAAGVLHADAAVRGLHGAAGAEGADVRLGVAVAGVEDDGSGVAVRLVGGEVVRARAAVVAAGAWARAVLGEVAGLPPLRVTLEQPAHFAPAVDVGSWPTFIHHPGAGIATTGPTAHGAYGLVGDEGVKVGFHGAGAEVDPGGDRPVDGDLLDELRRYVERWVPGVSTAWAEPAPCLYTTTPDHDPVVDRVGAVTILAGFSGHGFKFAPEVGEVACALALDGAAPDPRFALGDRTPHTTPGLPR